MKFGEGRIRVCRAQVEIIQAARRVQVKYELTNSALRQVLYDAHISFMSDNSIVPKSVDGKSDKSFDKE